MVSQQDIACGIEAEEKQNGARLFFWNLYVRVANKLFSSSGFCMSEDEDETCFFNMSRYDETETTNRLALFEDFELRGFLPLVPAQQILDFSRKQTVGSDSSKEKQARVHRIIAAGKALANVVQVGQHKIYFDSKLKRFTIGVEPQISDDHLLSSSLALSDLSGVGDDNSRCSQASLKGVEPMLQLSMYDEEEDEVIVFKPSVDKFADGEASKPISFDFLSNKANITNVGLLNHLGPVSASQNGLLLQNGFSFSQGQPSSFANVRIQYVQLTTSNWLVDKEVPMVNEFANLSFVENGFGALQPAGHSMPYPYQSINVDSGIRYSIQLPETSVASRFDPVMSSGVGMDSISVKALTNAPAGLRKNPVSRPVRHSDPPPGFSSAPAKQVDVPLPLQNNHPTVDDYSWLDG